MIKTEVLENGSIKAVPLIVNFDNFPLLENAFSPILFTFSFKEISISSQLISLLNAPLSIVFTLPRVTFFNWEI